MFLFYCGFILFVFGLIFGVKFEVIWINSIWGDLNSVGRRIFSL